MQTATQIKRLSLGTYTANWSKKKELFQNVDKFVRYRIGLMEKGLSLLDFTSSDNNYMTQVHDYKGVSVWRMDSDIKNCSKTVIGIFQKYYPELLYAKYFVNVPTVFGWVYDLIKSSLTKPPERSSWYWPTAASWVNTWRIAHMKGMAGKIRRTIWPSKMSQMSIQQNTAFTFYKNKSSRTLSDLLAWCNNSLLYKPYNNFLFLPYIQVNHHLTVLSLTYLHLYGSENTVRNEGAAKMFLEGNGNNRDTDRSDPPI